jgi:hypothetical protein
MRGGDGHCGQTGRDEDDSAHWNLLGDGHPPVPFSGGAPVEVRTDLRDQHWSAGPARRRHTWIGLKKIEQGRGPAPKNANPLNLTLSLRLEFLLLIETAAAFAPACPPKTWTARSSARQVASPLDLATSTLADLPELVTEK